WMRSFSANSPAPPVPSLLAAGDSWRISSPVSCGVSSVMCTSPRPPALRAGPAIQPGGDSRGDIGKCQPNGRVGGGDDDGLAGIAADGGGGVERDAAEKGQLV